MKRLLLVLLLVGILSMSVVASGCISSKTTTSSTTTSSSLSSTSSSTSTSSTSTKKQVVTLTAYLAAPSARWDALIKAAEKKFNEEHPNIEVKVNYIVLPYDQMHKKLITMSAAKAKADIVSMDQIWLGQFAAAGYLTDLTSELEQWGVQDKLYAPYVKGCMYNGKYYGIWIWTDARLMWYRKDVLQKAGVSPDQLKTWSGFLAAVPKINAAAKQMGMLGVAFPGAPWLTDWWYPFLFENGGHILVQENGHYVAGFNNDAGIKAAEFLQEMAKAGVNFPTTWKWGEEFASGRYAIWFGGTWVYGKLSKDEINNVGVMMFPAPAGKEPRTLSGGWLLAIPKTSEHPKIAWEFIQTMLQPDVLTPVLVKYTYLPTEKYIGDNPKYSQEFANNIVFWPVFKKALQLGAMRPNIPQYPQIAQILYNELDKVVYGKATPQQAIETAANQINQLLGGG